MGSDSNNTLSRNDAHILLDRMPEEILQLIIDYMKRIDNGSSRRTVPRKKNSKAFKRLEELCRSIPDLDYEKELDEWRHEKYGN